MSFINENEAQMNDSLGNHVNWCVIKQKDEEDTSDDEQVVKNETTLKSNLLSLNLSQFINGFKKFSGTGV